MEERRKIYRVEPEKDHEITFSLENAAGEVFEGEVLDVSHFGIAARFPREKVPTLSIGEQAILVIGQTNARTLMRLKARTKNRVEEEASRRYGFQFDEPVERAKELAPQLLRLFNQRNAYRVEPDPEEPIEIILRLGKHQTTGCIKDISMTGVCAIVELASDVALAAVEEVEISFCLSSSDTTVKLNAWICNRRSHDKSLLYGLQFSPESVKSFETDITNYIMHRQREILQQSAYYYQP